MRVAHENIKPKAGARLRVLAILALGLAAMPAAKSAAAADASTVGVTKFDFTDNASETQFVSPARQTRLQHFADALRSALEKTGHFHVVAIPCPGDPCVGTPADGDELLKSARKSGATLLVVGGIHRMTGVVTFMKADVYRVATDRPILSKMYTMRGDNDAAWAMAADALADAIKAHD
jgi:hypothetical protein